jgi:Flp pilus assembly protein TadG
MPRRGARAQSMVEFAIVVPLFLLLIFGIIDFSRLLFTYVSLTNGARELARNLVISTSTGSTSSDAFSNLTLIAAGTQAPATSKSVTVTLAAGSGSGVITCTGSAHRLCTITLTSDANGQVTLTTQPSNGVTTQPSNGSAIFTATSGTVDISATSTSSPASDFITEAWMGIDGNGWPQGYVQVCPLELSPSCGLPWGTITATTPQNWFTNGFVQVNLGYTFQFNPLFQNRLAGVVDVSFMRPSTLVTTSVRSYAE